MKKKRKCRICGNRAEEGFDLCKACRSIRNQLDTNSIMMEMRETKTMSDREAKKFIRSETKERQKLMKMKREDRLRKICSDSLWFAYAIGRMVGLSIGRGKLKELTGHMARGTMNDVDRTLMRVLTSVKVLPLVK